MDKKNILVTGSNGQLGKSISLLAASYPNFNFFFTTRDNLPIENVAAVEEYFITNKINCCINCAAYTAVDKAETETETAFAINGTAVGTLARLSNKYAALFIHISTDYVFSGEAAEPYKEDHAVNPVNLYGASKLKGEELALQNNAGSIIIRTSWVYAPFGNNFVRTVLRLMKERTQLNVVSDQQGCPTYAPDLADVILKIVTKLNADGASLEKLQLSSNIFHYSNTGVINWFQFAIAIKELSKSTCQVNAIPTSSYPTPAKRPAYSIMDTSKIQQVFDIDIPFWKDSLQECINRINC